MFKKIYIEITNICNLKCEFCPETSRKKEYMDINKFEKVVGKVCKHTNLVCLHVKGEPLLHPQFEEILKILEKYNLSVNITTNGTLLENWIDVLNRYNIVRQINISLHSLTENSQMNEKYLRDVLNFVDKLNEKIIVSYRLWNMKKIGENAKNETIIKALSEHYDLKYLNTVLEKNAYVKLKENIFINQDVEFTWPNVNGERIIDSGRCLALKDQIGILVDGRVVPCCLDNNGDIVLGNIFDEDLKKILEKDFSKEIIKNFQNGKITCELCKTCGFLKKLEEKRA